MRVMMSGQDFEEQVLGALHDVLERSELTIEDLEKMLAEFQRSSHALFVAGAGRAGFPCVLPHSALPIVRAQLERQQFSLQALARALKGRSMAPVDELDLFNVNTPQDWEQARQFWSERFRPALSSRRPKDGQPPLVIGGRRV